MWEKPRLLGYPWGFIRVGLKNATDRQTDMRPPINCSSLTLDCEEHLKVLIIDVRIVVCVKLIKLSHNFEVMFVLAYPNLFDGIYV